METLGQRLRQLRIKNKKSQKQIAALVGVPASTYRDWEYGKQIKGEPYAQLAKALNVSLVELLTGEAPLKGSLMVDISELEDIVKRIKSTVLALR